MKLKNELLNKIPESPGIYLMKDRKEKILYIGKAKALKSRVKSYFQNSETVLPRTRVMIKKIADIDFIATTTEIEALILESNFIKKHQPRYNVLLKDDKHYPFIRLATDTDFPYLSIVRKVNKDGAAYFGPYTMAKEVRETLKLIYKIFQIRQSRDDLGKKTTRRPCLNYQIKKCKAPCSDKISKEDYDKIVQDVILFLKGRNDKLLSDLRNRMLQASEELRFEEAAKLRNQIHAVKNVINKQKIISTNLKNQDIIAFYREGDASNMQTLLVRNGKMSGEKNYNLKNLNGIDNDEILSSFIKQYYANEPSIPEEILLPIDIAEKNIISLWLSGKKNSKVSIQVPEKGGKKRLVKMAEENARFAFRKEESSQALLEDLKEILSLQNIPERIEAFDISNISGSMAAGASVLFFQGEPRKKGYRHFKIRGIEGSDDYRMMSQVILRHYGRLLDEKKDLPQLIVIDGGKGHLRAASKALGDLDLLGKVDIIAIAKGKERNNILTDEIYSKKFKDPISFPVDSPVKFLLQRIRNEAHRFAIAYHRKLRKKGGLSSILDNIAGIGEKRKKSLIKHFGGVAGLKEASVEEINKAPFISEKIAQIIKAKI